MKRSSYIDWLLEQQHRTDEIGDLSRAVVKEMEDGFNPIEMDCLVDRFKSTGDIEMAMSAYSGLLEFGSMLQSESATGDIEVKVIEPEDVLKMKLDSAIESEDYEKAAKIRDEINKK